MHMSNIRYATNATRFKEPMTDEAIFRVAPSVFATGAHESRSERFAYIPTSDVMAAMRREGFQPMMVAQGRSRIEGKAAFTKHLIRFRHADFQTGLRRGDTVPEVVLVNAHDGTSAYKMYAGSFRIICLNGLIVADSMFESISVPHKGDVIGKVIDGAYRVIEGSKTSVEAADAWAGLSLSRDAQLAFAESAHALRFADAEGNVATAIKPEQLLIARRHEDAGNDLWRTFNRVQENAVRGGLTAMGRDANGRRRRTTTREVAGIDGNVRLNRELWALGERMAQILGRGAA